MTKIKGKRVLITGGASGIGKLMGESCLEKEASDLIIWDFNKEAVDICAKEFLAKRYKVTSHLVDVSNLNQIQEAAASVLEDGAVDILINNAGIVAGVPFHQQSALTISKTLAVNIEGVMQVTRAFLPAMIAKKAGHIVTIASASGMMSIPNMSVYAGSKWADLGWSESLKIELDLMKADLQVTSVTPGYIDTGMFKGVKPPLLLPLLKPKAMVTSIIKGIELNKLFVCKPFIINCLPFVRGILPTRLFDWLVGSVLGVYKSMDYFTGRS